MANLPLCCCGPSVLAPGRGQNHHFLFQHRTHRKLRSGNKVAIFTCRRLATGRRAGYPSIGHGMDKSGSNMVIIFTQSRPL